MNQTMNFEALGLACPKCRCPSAVVCAARNAHNAMALQCLQCEGTYFESDTAGRTVIGYVQKLRFYQPEGTRPEHINRELAPLVSSATAMLTLREIREKGLTENAMLFAVDALITLALEERK